MKATIIKTGKQVNVTDLHNGYYLDEDNNPYRADELQLDTEPAPDEPPVTILVAGDGGTVRQTLEAIMFLADQGQQRLADLADKPWRSFAFQHLAHAVAAATLAIIAAAMHLWVFCGIMTVNTVICACLAWHCAKPKATK